MAVDTSWNINGGGYILDNMDNLAGKKMKLIQKKMDELIKKHKLVVSIFGNKYGKSELISFDEEDRGLLTTIGVTGKKIALLTADCKCQKCKATENLTIHHLIMKHMESYMGFVRFSTQRNYWANQIVLCIYCHKKVHKISLDDDMMIPINKDYLINLKKEFYEDENSVPVQ